MKDSDFDPCECVIFSHEWAMRRLLSLLRQSQAYCTDNECLNELPGDFNNSNGQDFLMLAFCWIIMGFLLYYLRPPSLRNGENKPHNDRPGTSGNSPTPPSLR